MPRTTKVIRSGDLPIAGFVAGRMKLTCPAGTKQIYYTDDLIKQGLAIYKTQPNMKLRVFKTSVASIKASKETVDLCNESMPKRAESLAQWASHLMSIALDHAKLTR